MLPLHAPAPISESLSDRPLTVDDTLRQLSAQGFVLFHPTLAERLDSFKAAVWMGHALYWTRHLAKHQPRRGGWFFMTARQWQDATGLTTREQASVRALLTERGILMESIAGRPAKLHYKINLPAVTQALGLVAGEDGSLSWEAFSPWLRGSVSFYKPLADVAGSISAGLYLSYLLQAQRAVARNPMSIQPDGFFKVSHEDIRIALCLGPKVQRNARTKLQQAGLIEERGAMVRVRLDRVMAALSGTISDTTHRPRPAAAVMQVVSLGTASPAAAGVGSACINVNGWAGTPETAAAPLQHNRELFSLDDWLDRSPEGKTMVLGIQRMFAPAAAPALASLAERPQDQCFAPTEGPCQLPAVLSKLEVAVLSKPVPESAVSSNQGCRFVETQLPFCRTHISIENKTTTTTVRAHEAVDNSEFDKTAGRRRRDCEISTPAPMAKPKAEQAGQPAVNNHGLVLPSRLDKAWHQAVLGTVAQAPEAIRQALLDELDGQLGIAGKTIHNPAGWLHTLVRRHASGTLDLAMAEKVAADRQSRERIAKAIERAQAQPPQPAQTTNVNTDAPQLSESAKQARARLRELRAGLVAKGVAK